MFRRICRSKVPALALVLIIGLYYFIFHSSPSLQVSDNHVKQSSFQPPNVETQEPKPLLKPEPASLPPIQEIHTTRRRPTKPLSPIPTTSPKPTTTSTRTTSIATESLKTEKAFTPAFLATIANSAAKQSSPTLSPQATTTSKIHWKPSKEHYPIPKESIIPLPTGIPKALPPVQAKFDKIERPEARRKRIARKEQVKSEFLHAWNGYKNNAFFHDEVRPVSGATHDPFGGWAATLVDALDTLWIMGLTTEFEYAVQAVEKLDFTTYDGGEIRVFETTIRYLGGFLGAYDISGHKYPTLLKKAEELAEILYGVFDTPNRMPILSYGWEPDRVAVPQRAPNNAATSELGSLSMEFIRLAQITKENKYYDAVQRITDALEEYQNRTLIPGLWPLYIDTSGCGKVRTSPIPESPMAGFPQSAYDSDDDSGFDPGWQPMKRQLDGEQCEPQKLGRMENWYGETYNQGAMSDSLYEYLIKNYVLLGGLHEQYARMYKYTAEKAKQYLYFRPKVQGNKDILFAGQVHMKSEGAGKNVVGMPSFEAKTSHLMCFVGGMVGLGAQTLKLEADLSVAKKLTDGCVWAYNVTRSGLMPEEFTVMKCPSEVGCKFSEEEWLREAFPYPFRTVDKLPEPGVVLPPAPEDDPMYIDNSKKKFNHHEKRDGAGDESQSPLEIALGQAKAARRPPGMLEIADRRYILRPEAIESVFYMYRITGDTSWQEKGWYMFESAIKATKTKYGHSAVGNVFADEGEVPLEDSMESFWLAETLKYFYLLYSEPDVVSLDDYVFNTEAHPFLRPKPPRT